MNITINHYETSNSEPYDVEMFDNISNFSYDTEDHTIRFTLNTGKIYVAKYNHHIIVDIQVKGS